jgi:hypothetical protein
MTTIINNDSSPCGHTLQSMTRWSTLRGGVKLCFRLIANVANVGLQGGTNPEAAFPNGRRPADDVIEKLSRSSTIVRRWAIT